MTRLKLMLIAPAVVMVSLAVSIVMPVETRPQPASASQAAFDHSGCQYPDRWSNPADGCDNSDPAVPECIKEFSTKAGEDACIARLYPGTAEKRQAIAEHDAAINPAPAKVSECEGK